MLRVWIDARNLWDQIEIAGARSDVPEILAAADLYLMPSLAEAHSIAFLEALASGVYILASDIPSFEFGRHFEGVTLLDVTNDIRWIEAVALWWQSPQLAALNRDVSGFTIRDTALAYEELGLKLTSQ